MIDANTEVVIDSKDIEVIIDKNVSLIDNNINVKTLEPEYDITIDRKEYTVVGDELYIPKRYEDAPQWLRDVINNVTDVALSAKISEINNLTQSLNNLIAELEVAKNTYTMSVISSNDINERINTAIETLNSSVMESDATILGLATTRVTPEQAQAISIDAIRTSLNDTISGNSLGSIISGMQSTTTTGDFTNAQSIEVLQSTIEGNADATATAFNTINTYIGIDEAGASTGTGLSGYLEGIDGQIGSAGSKLINDVALKAGEVENKFAYNSTIKLNGVTHNSGFGLATSINSASIPEGDSQFWVSANEFKVVGANQTADAQGPFTVNTTTGDITFRGKVTFNSGQIGTIDEAIAQYVDESLDNKVGLATIEDIAVKLGYLSYEDLAYKASLGQTIVVGGYLRTGLIEASAITSDLIDAYAVTGKYISGGTISGTEINGTEINGAVINGARINGAVIKASYLDLDGELEVLTNYHITIAMYNANPSLYRDAVFISADNEYRIPSNSTINYYSTGVVFSNIYTNIWSYDKGDAGINTKSVKIRPVIQFSDSLEFVSPSFSPSNSYSAGLYFGAAHFISFSLTFSGTTTRVNIYRAGESTLQYGTQSAEVGYFTCSGVKFEYNLYGGGGFTLRSIGASPVFTLPTDFVNGRVQIIRGGTIASSGSVRMPSFTVFNML